jgi:hypothetical protein
MATMVVKHKVADFTAWKSVFDEMYNTRASHGWTGHEVLRDSKDPNNVMIVNRAKTLEGCIAYGQSPELKEAMQRAGVISAPEIILFNEEEKISY